MKFDLIPKCYTSDSFYLGLVLRTNTAHGHCSRSGSRICLSDLLRSLVAVNHANDDLFDRVKLDGVDKRIGADVEECQEECRVVNNDRIKFEKVWIQS